MVVRRQTLESSRVNNDKRSQANDCRQLAMDMMWN